MKIVYGCSHFQLLNGCYYVLCKLNSSFQLIVYIHALTFMKDLVCRPEKAIGIKFKEIMDLEGSKLETAL